MGEREFVCSVDKARRSQPRTLRHARTPGSGSAGPGADLSPGIHAVSFQRDQAPMEWIAGSSPAMTPRVEGGANRCGERREG